MISSESRFPRSYTTDPNYKSSEHIGNSTKNFITNAIFEGLIGIENFKKISSSSQNQFILAIGNHPFQYNYDVPIGKLYTHVYQRHRLVLVINSIIQEIYKSFTIMNENIQTIM